MNTAPDHDERLLRIAALLLANRQGTEDWGDISSQKTANRFLLCCLLDYQMNSEVVWDNGYRLVAELGDPDNIWSAVASMPEAQWRSRHGQYRLHRFPAAHDRLWPIATRMCNFYSGDARCIWTGKPSAQVVNELLALGAGEQISRMIVGALRDCGQIRGASDLKADVYVRRVLGRALLGRVSSAKEATDFARKLYPTDPWQLDWPLWNIGTQHCHAQTPECRRCYLAPHCVLAQGIPAPEFPEHSTAPAPASAASDPDRHRALVRAVNSVEGNATYEQTAEIADLALSLTTYNSHKPTFLYIQHTPGMYSLANFIKVPFARHAEHLEAYRKTKTETYWRLKRVSAGLDTSGKS